MRSLPMLIIAVIIAVAGAFYFMKMRPSDNAVSQGIPITDAIETAEKNSSGKAYMAEFSNEDGQMVFSVSLLDNDLERLIILDAQTGNILTTSENTMEFPMSHFAQASLTLSQAIEAAKKAADGQVVFAEFHEEETPAYVIHVRTEQGTDIVFISPADGSVLQLMNELTNDESAEDTQAVEDDSQAMEEAPQEENDSVSDESSEGPSDTIEQDGVEPEAQDSVEPEASATPESSEPSEEAPASTEEEDTTAEQAL